MLLDDSRTTAIHVANALLPTPHPHHSLGALLLVDCRGGLSGLLACVQQFDRQLRAWCSVMDGPHSKQQRRAAAILLTDSEPDESAPSAAALAYAHALVSAQCASLSSPVGSGSIVRLLCAPAGWANIPALAVTEDDGDGSYEAGGGGEGRSLFYEQRGAVARGGGGGGGGSTGSSLKSVSRLGGGGAEHIFSPFSRRRALHQKSTILTSSAAATPDAAGGAGSANTSAAVAAAARDGSGFSAALAAWLGGDGERSPCDDGLTPFHWQAAGAAGHTKRASSSASTAGGGSIDTAASDSAAGWASGSTPRALAAAGCSRDAVAALQQLATPTGAFSRGTSTSSFLSSASSTEGGTADEAVPSPSMVHAGAAVFATAAAHLSALIAAAETEAAAKAPSSVGRARGGEGSRTGDWVSHPALLDAYMSSSTAAASASQESTQLPTTTATTAAAPAVRPGGAPSTASPTVPHPSSTTTDIDDGLDEGVPTIPSTAAAPKTSAASGSGGGRGGSGSGVDSAAADFEATSLAALENGPGGVPTLHAFLCAMADLQAQTSAPQQQAQVQTGVAQLPPLVSSASAAAVGGGGGGIASGSAVAGGRAPRRLSINDHHPTATAVLPTPSSVTSTAATAAIPSTMGIGARPPHAHTPPQTSTTSAPAQQPSLRVAAPISTSNGGAGGGRGPALPTALPSSAAALGTSHSAGAGGAALSTPAPRPRTASDNGSVGSSGRRSGSIGGGGGGLSARVGPLPPPLPKEPHTTVVTAAAVGAASSPYHALNASSSSSSSSAMDTSASSSSSYDSDFSPSPAGVGQQPRRLTPPSPLPGRDSLGNGGGEVTTKSSTGVVMSGRPSILLRRPSLGAVAAGTIAASTPTGSIVGNSGTRLPGTEGSGGAHAAPSALAAAGPSPATGAPSAFNIASAGVQRRASFGPRDTIGGGAAGVGVALPAAAAAAVVSVGVATAPTATTTAAASSSSGGGATLSSATATAPVGSVAGTAVVPPKPRAQAFFARLIAAPPAPVSAAGAATGANAGVPPLPPR